MKRVTTWSGKYIWNYVVRGETHDDNETSLSRDLGDAEEEMEKFQSSTNTMLASVSVSCRKASNTLGNFVHSLW